MKINAYLYFIVLTFLSFFTTDVSAYEDALTQAVENSDYQTLHNLLLEEHDEGHKDQRHLLSPIHTAAKRGNEDMFYNLICHATTEFLINHGATILNGFFTSWDQDKKWAMAMPLLRRGIDPNIMDDEGKGLLYYAIEAGQSAFVESLIGYKADLNIVDKGKRITPLYHAVLKNNTKITELLLKYRANPLAKDQEGHTPWDLVIEKQDMNVLELFMKWKRENTSKAAKKTKDSTVSIMPLLARYKTDPLFGLIFINDVEKIEEYLQNNPMQGHRVFDNGNTALHWAAQQNYPEVVALLLRHNARPDFRNNDGKTVRELTQNQAIINMLEQTLNELDDDTLLKTYYTRIPDAILALPAQNESINVEISFDVKANKILFSFNKSELLRSQLKLSFKKKPEQGRDRIVFQKTDKLPLIFDGIATHDKKKKPLKGRFWFVADLVLVKKNGQLFLCGKTNQGGDFSWALTNEYHSVEPKTIQRTSVKNVPAKITINQALEAKRAKTYPSIAELAGEYSGELNNELYTVNFPSLTEIPERIDLPFRIVRSDGKNERKLLWTRPEGDMQGDKITSLMPLSDGPRPKLFPNHTTWEGQRIMGKKNGGLRFVTTLRVAEKIENQPISFSIETHRGMLVLSKHIEQYETEQGEIREQEITHALEAFDGDEEGQTDFEDDDRPPAEPDFFALEDEEPLAIVPPAPIRRQAQHKSNKPQEPYFAMPSKEDQKERGMKLGFSTEEQEKFDRERKRLMPKMIQVGVKRQHNENTIVSDNTESKTKSVIPKIDHTAVKPRHLSPKSALVENPLYQEDMIWFADGWEKHDDGVFRPNIFLNFAFSLKNLNDLEQFAPQASWCSLFTRAQENTNFQNGMNVHCSYHENDDKKYLHISHFGLFLIERDCENERFVLHRVPDPGSNERMAYVLRPLKEMIGKWKKGNKKLSPVETMRRYAHCQSDVRKIVEENDCQHRRKITAAQIEESLKDEPLTLQYKNISLYAVFNSPDHEPYISLMNGQPWRKIEDWNVQMISDNLAFISIIFRNSHGNLEAITIKKIVS